MKLGKEKTQELMGEYKYCFTRSGIYPTMQDGVVKITTSPSMWGSATMIELVWRGEDELSTLIIEGETLHERLGRIGLENAIQKTGDPNSPFRAEFSFIMGEEDLPIPWADLSALILLYDNYEQVHLGNRVELPKWDGHIKCENHSCEKSGCDKATCIYNDFDGEILVKGRLFSFHKKVNGNIDILGYEDID